jgi:hypothetical protein
MFCYVYLECDTVNCEGPIQYYEDLQCHPIYEKPDDCCAVRYNCSVFNEVTNDKCYNNGNIYKIGEKLKDEDEDQRDPCDENCTCINGYNDE